MSRRYRIKQVGRKFYPEYNDLLLWHRYTEGWSYCTDYAWFTTLEAARDMLEKEVKRYKASLIRKIHPYP